MAEFEGFGVAGYRTLSGAPQWIPLDRRVTVFLGANNSGKSNVLRMVHQHMGPIFASLTQGHAIATLEARIDASRGEEGGLSILWPLDGESLRASPHMQAVRHDVETILELPQLNRCGRLSLPFTSPEIGAPLEITQETARELTEATVNQIRWGTVSSHLTHHGGGPPGDDAKRVLEFFRQWCIPPPETVFVPPSRSLSGGGEGADWNFSGQGMIYQLYRLKNPEFDEDALRARADALTDDLRVLLEDDELEFNVPHNQETVNFKLGGKWFRLDQLGTGTEHAVVILAARHVHPTKLLCLEEPDAHLHPRLQRRLVALLREAGGHRLAIATHSAHMIDAADTVAAVRLDADSRSSITQVGDHDLFDALRSLGYRASDLLQTNCIVWVEGPSDRIYLLRWLREVEPELIEGVDFSIMFYGGALLARLTAQPEAVADPTLVDLWRINRRMWVVMDSDRGDGELKPAVERLQSEIAAAGTGGTWITAGYTIENYVEADELEAAVRLVHPSVESIEDKRSGVDPLMHLVTGDGDRFSRVDKVAIALAVVAGGGGIDVLDLREQVMRLATFIRESSHGAVVVPIAPDLPPEPAE